MKLSGITAASVQEAVQAIDQQKLSAKRLDSDFRVLVNDRHYPFKLLVETAYKIATGNALPAGTFKEYFYLIKQFQEFTGYPVDVSSPILFRKYIGIEVQIIRSASPIFKNDSIDLSMLGPDVNDVEV